MSEVPLQFQLRHSLGEGAYMAVVLVVKPLCRWTVIVSQQIISTAKLKFKTLHVRKRPSRSSHLVTSKFVWAKFYHNGSTGVMDIVQIRGARVHGRWARCPPPPCIIRIRVEGLEIRVWDLGFRV